MAITLSIPSLLLSQFEFQDHDPSGTILPLIQNVVKAKYGSQFDVFFIAFDSMIGNTPRENKQGRITDPFGTLQHTIFFWGAPDHIKVENQDSVFVGMFKNKDVVWITPPVYMGGGITQIYATLDLNNDGKVDIITMWSPSYRYSFATDIIIFSWDGSKGHLISDDDSITGETNLYTTGSILKLIKKKNGIYNLKAYWSDQEDMRDDFPDYKIPTRPWVTYRWNGAKYILEKRGK